MRFQYWCSREATTTLATSKEEAIMIIAKPVPLNRWERPNIL